MWTDGEEAGAMENAGQKATNRQGLVVEKVEKKDMKHFKPASLYEPPRCDATCEEPHIQFF